jgi:hypothetical protein
VKIKSVINVFISIYGKGMHGVKKKRVYHGIMHHIVNLINGGLSHEWRTFSTSPSFFKSIPRMVDGLGWNWYFYSNKWRNKCWVLEWRTIWRVVDEIYPREGGTMKKKELEDYVRWLEHMIICELPINEFLISYIRETIEIERRAEPWVKKR